jgi:hypothetical protein
MFGLGFWFGPALFSSVLIFVFALTVLRVIEPALGIIMLVIFGIATYVQLSGRVRNYQAYRQDLEMGVAQVLAGPPERVWMEGRLRPRSIPNSSYGFCFIAIGGRVLRIPNDQFKETGDANSVKVAFLPTSGIVVELEVARGLGLSIQGAL